VNQHIHKGSPLTLVMKDTEGSLIYCLIDGGVIYNKRSHATRRAS